ncbi:MAG: M28 family peptidase [Candidatus Dormiibacterota bacterium]
MIQDIDAGRRAAEEELLGRVSARELMEWTTGLAKWEKVSGTPGEQEAVGYLAAQLEGFGLATKIHRFESLLGWPEEASIEVEGAGLPALPALAHALTPSTTSDGLVGRLAYVGDGKDDRLLNAVGAVALVEGMPLPATVLRGDQAGVAALIFIQEDRLHDLCVSPVWGTPTRATSKLLPHKPVVSLLRDQGEFLKHALSESTTEVRLRSKTFRGWREVPILTAEIRGRHDPDHFVMLSGHHCSWYYGAMDNSSADAALLEVAKLLGEHRAELTRSVRIAFWPGHTQGRYSGSTWYFDHFWEEISEYCVLHINVDSLGATGARFYRAECMPETEHFTTAAISDAIGVESESERQARGGDQAFWSCGVPSAFMCLSYVAAEDAAPDPFDEVGHGEGPPSRPGLPWWWHTPEDTIDRIDPDVLVRDTRVILLASYRAAAESVLPLQCAPAASDILKTLEDLQDAAGGRFDLESVISQIRDLESRAIGVEKRLEQFRSQPPRGGRVGIELNRLLLAVDRELVLVNFSASGPFDQDLAVPVSPVPLLEPVRVLASLDARSDEARFLENELVRHRNKVSYHLKRASAALASLEDLLGRLERRLGVRREESP